MKSSLFVQELSDQLSLMAKISIDFLCIVSLIWSNLFVIDLVLSCTIFSPFFFFLQIEHSDRIEIIVHF